MQISSPEYSLPHGAASQTQCKKLRLIPIRPQGHRELCNEVISQELAEHLVGFEPESF